MARPRSRKTGRILAGAALAAYRKKRAKVKRRGKNRAKGKRKGNPNGSNKRRRPVAKKKGKRRGRRRGRGGYGKRRLNVALAGAGYGWLRKNQSELLAKLPIIESIGATATHAVAAHFLAKYFRSRWFDYLATALAGHCGIELGYADFKLDEFASVQGDGGAVVGALDL